jgi:hypothetical protein
MVSGKQFQEMMRTMFCMDFDTFREIFPWSEIDKYKTFQENPARFICHLDSYWIEILFQYLKAEIDKTPNSIKIIKDMAA